MKRVAFKVIFEVEDDTDEQELQQGMYDAMNNEFVFDDTETCTILRVMDPPEET